MKSGEVLEILTEVVSTCNAQVWTLSHEQLDKFAEVVYMRGRIEGAAAEREAILEHCEAMRRAHTGYQAPSGLIQLIDTIRARGET
jgi:hypothetical protein